MTTVLFSITFVQAIQAGNTLILAYPKEITLISSFLKGWNFPVFFICWIKNGFEAVWRLKNLFYPKLPLRLEVDV